MRIPEDTLNSHIEYCVREYVRLERDRGILLDHWFGGLSYYELSEKYAVSDTTVKRVILKLGDTVLLRASKMT